MNKSQSIIIFLFSNNYSIRVYIIKNNINKVYQ